MRYYITSILLILFAFATFCGSSRKSIEASKGNCTDNHIEADDNVAADKYGNSSLAYAVTNGYGGCAAYLIENGTDVNSKDKLGRPAIIGAALNNHEHIVRLLIEKGANVDATDSEGKTALMYMVLQGNNEGAKSLLDANANVNAKDSAGNHALIFSCQNPNSDVEMLKLLVTKGADVNHVGAGQSAMAAAKARNYTDKYNYLKGLGAVEQAATPPAEPAPPAQPSN